MSARIAGAFDLTGRVAIVTGGTRGLGEETASWYAEAGADVVVVGRDLATADEVAARLPKPGRGYGCDVADESAVSGLTDWAVGEFGRIDILVNSAGVNVRGEIGELTLEEFEYVQRVNVTGTWLMCRAVAPVMLEAGYGRIINLGSINSVIGMPGRSAYGTSKGAVLQLTRTLAIEWASRGIAVNAVLPGPFKTDMNTALLEDPVKYEEFVSSIPVGRFAETPEIGPLMLLLAAEASGFITGAGFAIDGGWTAR